MSDEKKLQRKVECVKRATFSATRLLTTRGEIKAFYVARDLCGETDRPRCYVMAQVSYGEMFDSKDRRAYNEMNCLRCDLAIIGLNGRPLVVMEVHGGGHRGENDEIAKKVCAHDEIKQHVCESAGVVYRAIRGPVTRDVVRISLAGLLPDIKAVRRAS